jgi:hypothetical protein
LWHELPLILTSYTVWGLAKEDKLLEASVFGFRGWQVNPNLIFGDGEIRLRPQMEVWFCAIAGTYAARHHALIGTGESKQN